MKIEKNAPALPCMPMQDSLGRFFSPISGFTKYEYVVFQIYKDLCIENIGLHKTPVDNMNSACYYADIYFKYLNDSEDEIQKNQSTIIQ